MTFIASRIFYINFCSADINAKLNVSQHIGKLYFHLSWQVCTWALKILMLSSNYNGLNVRSVLNDNINM